MYLDVQNLFSEDQDISQVAGTYESTNALDLNATPRPVGPGEVVKILAQMTAALTSAGAATLKIELVEASAATLDADVVILDTTPVLAKGTCVAGYKKLFVVPLETIGQRYIGLRYVIATATTTAGTITAGIVLDTQTADSNWTAVTGL